MGNINIKAIVGDTFEDMSIAEMTLVQGSGDVSPESTPACVIYSAIQSAAVTAALSILSVRTIKGNC